MNPLVKKAKEFATKAHEGVFRKWGGDPYIKHPERVAAKVAELPATDEYDVAAAWLHDVIEDVALKDLETYKELLPEYQGMIRKEFGDLVLELVMDLTSPSEWPEWEGKPRSEKRKVDWPHLQQANDRAKRIKLVDRWDNMLSVDGRGYNYMVNKYIPESWKIHSICRHVDEEMAKELAARIKAAEDYFKKKKR